MYALRWESARTGKSGYAPATAAGWNRHGPKTYLPLSDDAIASHLRGRESIGVYPLLEDDTCWFLACDLDGKTWQLDALALLEACDEYGVPATLERSRSGTGGHVWVFLAAPVATAVGAVALSPQRTLLGDERLPAEVRCTIGADLAIARADLLPSLLAELKHLASLHNPLFYERQRLRLSTHQTPRLIRCYEEDLTHLHLPRGRLGQVEGAVADAGSRLVTDDRRPTHPPLPLAFLGELTPTPDECCCRDACARHGLRL